MMFHEPHHGRWHQRLGRIRKCMGEDYGRILNFGAGPAVLPLEVVEEVANSLPNLKNSGFGVLEISHRSGTFQEVIDSANRRIRDILSVPDDYEVLFLQGGASTQFYMTALNLIDEEEKADFILTGVWSKKAMKEASRIGKVEAIWDGTNGTFRTIPQEGEYKVSDDSIYVHYTSNNTLFGTQFKSAPKCENKPLVVDASSDICGVPIDVSSHEIIYAGAQKNLGPSGVTLVLLSPWAKSRIKQNLPTMLDYNTHISKGSMFNTPNTFGIFVLDRVLAWVQRNGGLEGAIERNKRKSKILYEILDKTGFWKPHADVNSRSVMNITWNLYDDNLEEKFLYDAEKNGIGGLRGHRSIGGIRASLYNGCPIEDVEKLAEFMEDFERNY